MKNSFYSNTQIIGVIGHPIKHSFSPFIHNISIELKKMDYIYLPFDVHPSNLKSAINGMLALNIKGFNVTVPHKEAIIKYLNVVSEEASLIGAVNTIVNEQGRLYGYNTDSKGVYESLVDHKEAINHNNIVVIGAGGASRSVVYTLIRNFRPEKITIINRSIERAEVLKSYFSQKMNFDNLEADSLYSLNLRSVIEQASVIINSTPVGTAPDMSNSVLEDFYFHKNHIVFDLVYNPVETKFLQNASSKGATTITGLKMLVHQAAKSFELWTGEEMPINEVHKSLQLFNLA